jgi:hypothetical protein
VSPGRNSRDLLHHFLHSAGDLKILMILLRFDLMILLKFEKACVLDPLSENKCAR